MMPSNPENTHPDVLVIGAGAAGLAAAWSAAARGARVLLADQAAALGGTGTHALLTALCGLYRQNPVDGENRDQGREPVQLLGGPFGAALVQGLAKAEGRAPLFVWPVHILPYETGAYGRVAADLLAGRSSVQVALGTRVVAGALDGDRIAALTLEDGSGRQQLLQPRVVIDCSGDGVSAALFPERVGADMESLEQIQCPAASLVCAGVDGERLGANYRVRLRLALHHGIKDGLSPWLAQVDFSWAGPGRLLWKMNLDPLAFPSPAALLDPAARESLHQQALAVLETGVQHLRVTVPGCEAMQVAATSIELGVRETRRLHGATCLGGADLLAGKTGPDTVAVGAWPVEKWQRGAGISLTPIARPWYGVPYGSLYAPQLANLLFAGRCLSADHEAQASIRVMGTCYSTGEAVGGAAALACQGDGDVRRVEPAAIRDWVIDLAGGAYPELQAVGQA